MIFKGHVGSIRAEMLWDMTDTYKMTASSIPKALKVTCWCNIVAGLFEESHGRSRSNG